eukprot:m.51016 g.51016  ORF g.51016 m.51016 type:complete len:251 (+) comp7279_c0_seq1:248-1000(+)
MASVVVCTSTILAATFVALVASLRLTTAGRRARTWFTAGPLGLHVPRHRRPKRHAVLDVARYDSIDMYIASLARSPRRSLTKGRCLDPALCLQMSRPWDLGWEHFGVTLDHEHRAMSSPIGARIVAVVRILVAMCMLGEVVEYRTVENNELVAWSMTVCKGTTVRGQWFYQQSAWCKKLIWFHSVVHTIEAVITARQHGSPLRWIDVGPSGSSAVEAVKEKLGFTVTDKWRDEGWCDYEGSYTDLFALTP